MKTKVTILGSSAVEEPKKKIEFVKYLSMKGWEESASETNVYDNIELVCKNYTIGYDLMYAYDNNMRDTPSATLYIGKFNDGVV